MEYLRLVGKAAKEDLGQMRSISLFHNDLSGISIRGNEAIKIFSEALYSCVVGVQVRYSA